MEYLHSDLTKGVLSCAFSVHNELGPGLLESSYEACLYYELKQKGYKVDRQVHLPLVYKDIKLDAGYRIDLLINKKVIVEIKAVDYIIPIHTAQLLTYLRLSGCRIGLLINFNVKLLKDGISRLIV